MKYYSLIHRGANDPRPLLPKRPVDELKEILGPALDLTHLQVDQAAAKAFLAELDRQNAVIIAKKLDKNGNYDG